MPRAQLEGYQTISTLPDIPISLPFSRLSKGTTLKCPMMNFKEGPLFYLILSQEKTPGQYNQVSVDYIP